MERTGWCGQEILGHTTPAARANVASQLSLDRASTPPPAEEGSRLLQLAKRSGNLDSNAPCQEEPKMASCELAPQMEYLLCCTEWRLQRCE